MVNMEFNRIEFCVLFFIPLLRFLCQKLRQSLEGFRCHRVDPFIRHKAMWLYLSMFLLPPKNPPPWK